MIRWNRSTFVTFKNWYAAAAKYEKEIGQADANNRPSSYTTEDQYQNIAVRMIGSNSLLINTDNVTELGSICTLPESLTDGIKTISFKSRLGTGVDPSRITFFNKGWDAINYGNLYRIQAADGLADLSGRVTTTSFTAIANGADAAITIAANKYSDGTFGANNAPAGKAADWGLANSISTTDFDTYYNQYLLNVAPEASTAIEIKKVEMGDSAATITVEAAAGVDWSTINGALTISVSEDLANWVDLPADAEGITVTPDADNANQATITIALPEGNKYFVKALVK